MGFQLHCLSQSPFITWLGQLSALWASDSNYRPGPVPNSSNDIVETQPERFVSVPRWFHDQDWSHRTKVVILYERLLTSRCLLLPYTCSYPIAHRAWIHMQLYSIHGVVVVVQHISKYWNALYTLVHLFNNSWPAQQLLARGWNAQNFPRQAIMATCKAAMGVLLATLKEATKSSPTSREQGRFVVYRQEEEIPRSKCHSLLSAY